MAEKKMIHDFVQMKQAGDKVTFLTGAGIGVVCATELHKAA